MRNVKFKEWIPTEYIKSDVAYTKKPGTGCLEDDFTKHGVFHQWGIAYEEFETGIGNYTVGIIELPDGTIKEMASNSFKFI